jgi:hypothetical protein
MHVVPTNNRLHEQERASECKNSDLRNNIVQLDRNVPVSVCNKNWLRILTFYSFSNARFTAFFKEREKPQNLKNAHCD